jgi:hypothetical protein
VLGCIDVDLGGVNTGERLEHPQSDAEVAGPGTIGFRIDGGYFENLAGEDGSGLPGRFARRSPAADAVTCVSPVGGQEQRGQDR